jgi:UDP-3-O-[3-hydroxymyristoyl] glucosamine N-acyltransferase
MKFTAEQIAGIDGEVVGNLMLRCMNYPKLRKLKARFMHQPKYTNYIYTTEATITI